MPSEFAIGAARPTAQGQATTSTDEPDEQRLIERQALRPIEQRQRAEGQNDRHEERPPRGRRYAACGSTRHASRTDRQICAQRVCRPAPLLRISSGPSRLMLPASTAAPTPFAICRLSPVITASSVCELALHNHAVDRDALARPDPDQHPGTTSRTGRRCLRAASTTVAHSLSAANNGARSRDARARPAASR